VALDPKVIDELKSKHGSAVHIHIPADDFDDELDIVVKRPPRAEWKRFRTMLFNDEQKPEALETLACACVIYPEAADFKKLLVDRPALAEKVGGQCSDLAGGGGEAQAKKL